jgi:hypothetical protein
VAAVVFACLWLLCGTVSGQIRSSAITGTVTDPSGAVIPNANIVVTNEQTNEAFATRTTMAGAYTVPYLSPGQYTVSVSATGFQTYRVSGIALGTATTVRVDASLTTGTIATTIEVTASAATLQTENAAVQAAVSQNTIASIPNINNNPLYYAALLAGVVPDPKMLNTKVLGVGFQDRQAMSFMRVNGGLMGTNDVTLDGVSVQGAAWHETTVLPDRDALQEVRTTTNSFSADLGRGQGVIAMVTKSGTNEFHGTLSYRLRNEGLNANGLSNNMQGIPRSKYRVNEGGGTIGGPVILPKLYNGKDKMFFFVSFSRLKNVLPVNWLLRVPTELERKGDFSQTKVADNAGNPVPVQIFNPFTAQPYQGSTQVFERQPYPGSIIPNPDPYGLKILQSYPMPNRPPSDAFGNNNYGFSGSKPTIRNSLSTRLDYRIGERVSLYLSGGRSNGSARQPNAWGPDNPFVYMSFPGNINDDNPYLGAGNILTWSPTLVFDIRYGATRVETASAFPEGKGFDYSAYGMPANVQTLVAMWGTPTSIGNFGGPITALNTDTWRRKKESQLNHALVGSATKILNKWTIKAGGELRVYLGNWQDLLYATPFLNASNHNGQLGGLSGGNSALITNPALRGISFASALTGVAGYTLQAGTTTKPALASKYVGFYSQNDWKATNRLTINLGLRYEVQPGPTERFNRASSLDLTKTNPFAAGVSLAHPQGALGMVVFPGKDGYSRNLWDTQYDNLAPRLGAAYRLTKNTVLRGGFGRVFAPSNTGFNANGLIYGTGPFSGGAQAIPYGLSPNGVPIGRFSDPQNTLVVPAKGAVQDPSLYGNSNASLSVDIFDRKTKVSVVDQWNFFIETNLTRSWLISAGYVGSHGSKLPWRGFPLNGAFNIPDSTLQGWRDAWLASNGLSNPASVMIANPLSALVGKAAGSIGGATLSVLNSQLPYLPLLGQTTMANNSSSNYNAFQLKAEHTYSRGLHLMFNYTWSKSTGIIGGSGGATYAESQVAGIGTSPAGGTDFRNLNNNSGYLGYDITHRLVAVATYSLPTGKGQFLDPRNRVLRAITGDWQIGAVITMQSGEPWGVNCGGMNGRCFEVPGEPLELPKNLQGWYDGKTSVTLPSGRVITPGQYRYLKWNPDHFTAKIVQYPNGNYAVDQYWWGPTAKYIGGLRTPALHNVNLTVNRKVRVNERVQLELMADGTNIFNRTNFYPNAVNGGYSAVLTAQPTTNTKVGQNATVNSGSLGLSVYEPRQISLSARLRF